MGGLLGSARVGQSGQRMTAPRATGDGHRLVSWFLGAGGGGAPLTSCGAGALVGCGSGVPAWSAARCTLAVSSVVSAAPG